MDVIVMIILMLKIGKMAEAKRLTPLKWKLRFAALWIGLELLGFFVGVMIFSTNNLISCALVSYAFAIAAYFFMRNQLARLPDQFNEDDFGK